MKSILRQNLNIKTHMVNSQLVDAFLAEEDVFTNDNYILNTSKEEAGKYFVSDMLHLNEHGVRMYANGLKVTICKALEIAASYGQGSGNRRGSWRRGGFDRGFAGGARGYWHNGNNNRNGHFRGGTSFGGRPF